MHHGTPAVQRDIYQTPWFAALLGLLGVNVFSVMVSRYPWTKHHIGFLTAHVGILAILVGSVVSIYRGLDSNMALYEGETSDRVMLQEKALHVSLPGLRLHGSFPVAFEKRRRGRPRAALRGPGQRPGAGGRGVPAARDGVESFEAAARALPRCTSSCRRRWPPRSGGWCRTTRSAATSTSAWSRSASTGRRATSRRRRSLGHADGANHLSFVASPDGQLFFGASDAQGAIKTGDVAPGQPVPTGWPAMGVTVDRYLPAARLVRR